MNTESQSTALSTWGRATFTMLLLFSASCVATAEPQFSAPGPRASTPEPNASVTQTGETLTSSASTDSTESTDSPTDSSSGPEPDPSLMLCMHDELAVEHPLENGRRKVELPRLVEAFYECSGPETTSLRAAIQGRVELNADDPTLVFFPIAR